MKKSKIIVPALGMLLLSTAASVSGTVAWFTANRTYSNEVGSFHVGSVDGALEASSVITPYAGVMAEVDGEDKQTGKVLFQTKPVSAAVDSYLADASWDHKNNVLYTDNGSYTAEDGTNTSYFTSLNAANASSETNWFAGTKDSHRYYYGFAWTTTFEYTFGADTKPVNFFLDLTSAASATRFLVSRGAVVAGKDQQIEQALRIGVMCGSEKFVLAPFHNDSEAASIKYVNGTAPSGEPVKDPLGTYTLAATVSTANADLVASNHGAEGAADGKFTFDKAVDGSSQATHAARVDYLGQFTNVTPGSTNKLTVTFVVWLDGLDGVTDKDTNLNDTLSGYLSFYVATPAAA